MSLKEEHGYLYKRVRLKVLVHLTFGTILLFFPAQAPSLSRTPVLDLFGVHLIGLFYMVIGLMIAYGLLRAKHNYTLARTGMYIAAAFNTIIFFSLFAVFFQSKTTAFFMAIYGYFTYNVWYVARDPGWRAIELVKEMVGDARDSESN